MLAVFAQFSLAQQRALVQEDAHIQPRGLVALAIGNSAYTGSPLTNPLNDAKSMTTALQELGFASELVIDADYKRLGTSIDRFISRLRRGDVAVFYYAGHGMQIDGENYLVPTDFDARDEASARYAAYPADRLLEGMERSGAKLNIIILDACRNNPYRGSRAMGGGLAPMGSGSGTFVALATSPGTTASDNSKGVNGLFTGYLLDSLKQPGLTLDEVFNRTRALVYTASKGAQTPWTQTNVIGTFYFRPPERRRIVDLTGAGAGTVGGLSRASAGGPVLPQGVYFDGLRESRTGDPASAVEAFTSAIRQNPENLEAYYERAMTYAALGQFQRAVDDFNEVLRRRPGDTNALIGRGAARISFSDYTSAVPDFDLVIQKEPYNDVAYFDRGLAYAGLEQNRRAVDDYTQVIRRRPKWPSTWYNRGIVYSASGDFKNAISDYTEAVHLRPDYAGAYANRGVAHAELGGFQQALADLTQAINLQSSDASIFNSRGMVLLETGEPAKALNDFDEAIRLNPLLAVAYSNRAEARQQLGDTAGAQSDLKRARELGAR